MKEFDNDIRLFLTARGKPSHYKDIANYIIQKHNINPQMYAKSMHTRFDENLRNHMQYDCDWLVLLADKRADIQGKGGTGYFYFLSAYDAEQTTLTESTVEKRDYDEDLELAKKKKL